MKINFKNGTNLIVSQEVANAVEKDIARGNKFSSFSDGTNTNLVINLYEIVSISQ